MEKWLAKQEKKFLSRACLLILIFAVFGLAACSGGGGEVGSATQGNTPAEMAEIIDGKAIDRRVTDITIFKAGSTHFAVTSSDPDNSTPSAFTWDYWGRSGESVR